MKWILPALLLSLTCCHEPLQPGTGQSPAELPGISAAVVGNHDGDSLTVMMGGQKVKVRIEGIDPPEKGQARGNDSKSAVASIVSGRRVTIAPTGTDRHGRTLARVYADGGDVGRAMVRLGWAWHFLRYNKDTDLAAVEIEARKAKAELWKDPAPAPPWEWRKESRSKRPLNSKPQLNY